MAGPYHVRNMNTGITAELFKRAKFNWEAGEQKALRIWRGEPGTPAAGGEFLDHSELSNNFNNDVPRINHMSKTAVPCSRFAAAFY